jgi:hypothetical protein
MAISSKYLLSPIGKLLMVLFVLGAAGTTALWLLSGDAEEFIRGKEKTREGYQVQKNFTDLGKQGERPRQSVEPSRQSVEPSRQSVEPTRQGESSPRTSFIRPTSKFIPSSGNTLSPQGLPVDTNPNLLSAADAFSPDFSGNITYTPIQLAERRKVAKKEKELIEAKTQLEEIKQQNKQGKYDRNLNADRTILTHMRSNDPSPEAPEKKYRYSPVIAYFTAPKIDTTIDPNSLYAPYGSRLKCMLVTTVDSSNKKSPVIALVTEDLYHNGKVIIPAGTELHTSSEDVVRNRITTDSTWVVVWKTKDADNGKELRLTGKALDYDYNPATNQYGDDDGTYGLKGDVIETSKYNELKMYAALFTKKATEGLTEYLIEEVKADSKAGSTVVDSNVSAGDEEDDNEDELVVALASGASEVASTYADKMAEAIERDGVYVRVPAGSSFYLYVMQTIKMSAATRGGHIQSSGAAQRSQTTEVSPTADYQNAINSIRQEREAEYQRNKRR